MTFVKLQLAAALSFFFMCSGKSGLHGAASLTRFFVAVPEFFFFSGFVLLWRRDARLWGQCWQMEAGRPQGCGGQADPAVRTGVPCPAAGCPYRQLWAGSAPRAVHRKPAAQAPVLSGTPLHQWDSCPSRLVG